MSLSYKQAAKPKSASTKPASAAKTSAKPDVLSQIAQDVETLSQKKAFELADELIQQGGEDSFKLGGVLAVISEKAKSDQAWLEGCATFKELCEKRFNFTYQTAWNRIEVYKHLVHHQIRWDTVKSLGWTKVRVLAAKKVLTKENAASWVSKAEKLTVQELKDMLKNSDAPAKASTLTIRIKHKDQIESVRLALDRAKEEGNTEYDAVALSYICVGYLNGAVQTKPAALPDVEKGNPT